MILFKKLYLVITITFLLICNVVYSDVFVIEKDVNTIFYVIKDNVNVYARRNKNSKSLKKLKKGDTFVVNKKSWIDYRLKNNNLNQQWVSYLYYRQGTSGKGWVLLEDLTIDDSFIPVSLCWPFKKIEHTLGESFQIIDMNINGKGYATSNAGSKMSAQAYMYNDLIKIQFIVPKNSNPQGLPYSYTMAFILKYNKKKKQLLPINTGANLLYDLRKRPCK